MFQNPTFKKIAIMILCIIAALFIFIYSSAFVPILLAFITALALEPFVKFIEKRTKWKRRLFSVIFAFLTYLIVLIGIIYFTITKLFQQLIRFVYQLPNYISDIVSLNDSLIKELNDFITDIPQKHIIIQEFEKQGYVLVNKASTFAQDLIPLIASWIQTIPSLIVIFIVYLITTFLFSLDLPTLIKSFYNLFIPATADKISYIFKRLGQAVSGFLKAQFLVSIVIFIASYIGLLLITPEKALLMSIIIWIIDVIPFIGSIIIVGPWILYAMVVGNSALAIQLSILQVVLLVIRRTLEPKIMGEHIGIPVLPTLLSMYFGIYFLGVVGLALGPMIYIAIKSAYEAKIFTFNSTEESLNNKKNGKS
jgi:sporulation integral membrane protein YtvI